MIVLITTDYYKKIYTKHSVSIFISVTGMFSKRDMHIVNFNFKRRAYVTYPGNANVYTCQSTTSMR
jgi:hypothetical protein